ncbi:galactosylceramide sulfotransferase-like isoform X1 [Clavelina lepadiformis]|uniref:galactosylceramide sulfotransferase-like isoform X1 n=1 Tax=Clavelina lepadiformis TaxID=159417 RepID=UPI0040423D26
MTVTRKNLFGIFSMCCCVLLIITFWKSKKFIPSFGQMESPSQTLRFMMHQAPSISTNESGDKDNSVTTVKKKLKLTTTSNETCKSKTNIVFIKTHKTASTAIQNVLLRYGLHNNLKIAFPRNIHDFNYPSFFSTSSVAKLGSGPYNIVCHHMRMRYDAVKNLMPKDTPFVTIVREPGELFESTFDYFWPIVPSFQRVPHHGNTSMEDWLDKAGEHIRAAGHSVYAHFAKNPTFFDLGYNNLIDDDQYIEKTIDVLSKIFDLVMVSDYLDESMVLFADLLCWDLEHVACLSLNARSHDNEGDDVTRKARIREKARRWNKADALLFDHFNETLWRKVEEFGMNKMAASVRKLTQIRSNLAEICIDGGTAVDSAKINDSTFKKTIFKPKGVSVASYNLKPGAEKIATCRELIASENTFSKQVFDAQ